MSPFDSRGLRKDLERDWNGAREGVPPIESVDRALLAEILEADQQGGINGRDLAGAVGIPGRSVGSRLTALVKRGLIRGEYYGGINQWFITPAGEREVLDG